MFGAFQTFGKLGAIGKAIAAAWSPLALWPNGAASPGMWIDPSLLTASFNDSTGTTPVAVPGSVADSANPVGLALDIRAGAPTTLGPELVVNGDFSDGTTGWVLTSAFAVSGGKLVGDGSAGNRAHQDTVTTAGKWYQVSFDYVSTTGVELRICNTTTVALASFSVASGTSGTHSAKFLATGTTLHLEAQLAGFTGTIDNISVKEVPGNHMLQSTSAARPLMSARVNTLTYTEDFANSVWVIDVTGDGTLTKTLSQTDPLGNATAVRLLASSMTTGAVSFRYSTGLAAEQVIRSAYIKSNTGVGYSMYLGDTTITLIADTEWHRYDVSEAMFSWAFRVQFTSSADITLAFPQRELGTTATTYQRVTTDSDYDGDPAKFPYYLKFDGVDDGMATASFAAGTLTSAMDCMIPVRRDSGAACVAGLYNGIADATKFFGMAESASGSGCVGSGAGTPTVWVDGVQLTGGTAVTRGTLHTALTVGDYHILEFRGLDLSTWTASGFGLYTSYVFPGPRGDILLFPSTASTEDKDAARQYLADYYGVTLP